MYLYMYCTTVLRKIIFRNTTLTRGVKGELVYSVIYFVSGIKEKEGLESQKRTYRVHVKKKKNGESEY